MFQIGTHPRLNAITITVKGFLTPDEVPMLAAAIGTAAREARAVDANFNVIVYSLDFPVQAHDVADTLVTVMRGGMAQTGGHAAVVVGSHLNKLQAERTLVHPRLRVFLTIADAERWLAEPMGDVATA